MAKALAYVAGLTLALTGTAFADEPVPSVVPNAGLAISMPVWDQQFTVNEDQPLDQTDPLAVLAIQERAQGFSWGGKGGKWSMNLDMVSRPEQSPLPREEMRAGATYQFTPRFSLGGSLSFGAEELDDVSMWEEQTIEAGVRVKSTLKF